MNKRNLNIPVISRFDCAYVSAVIRY